MLFYIFSMVLCMIKSVLKALADAGLGESGLRCCLGLQLLARAFQEMGQDDNEQFTGLALHLASDFYMEHSSKDVRLLIACCIADVFRIFAPEAPYKEQDQLKV